MNSLIDKSKFFFGVVENREDPLKLGRVKVRCLGYHTKDKSEIPTSSLPWATISLPTNSNGSYITPPKDGSWVFGIFLDGDSAQKPLVLGLIFGIPESIADSTFGFSDQRSANSSLQSFPNKILSRVYNVDGTGMTITEDTTKENPSSSDINNPELSPLSRNETDNTIVADKITSRVTSIDTATTSGITASVWSEPEVPYNPTYPFNNVIESESGHVIEIDDTPGNERLHTAHRTGTFEEIHPDGSKVVKIVGDDYEINLKDKNLYVMGNINITVQGDAKILVEGNSVTQTKGNKDEYVNGNYKINVDGNLDIDADNVFIN